MRASQAKSAINAGSTKCSPLSGARCPRLDRLKPHKALAHSASRLSYRVMTRAARSLLRRRPLDELRGIRGLACVNGFFVTSGAVAVVSLEVGQRHCLRL